MSPMEEDLWIEWGRSLQVDIPQNIIPYSPSKLTQSAQVQDIVQEDLGLGVGQVGMRIQHDDEGNNVDHIVIHQPR